MATRQIKAEDTSMVFGRGPHITDRNELVKNANGKIREYLVTSWDHDEDSDLLENQALSPGRAGVSDEINYLWGSGPFSVQVPSEDGYLDLVQALLNDPNPVSTKIPVKTLIAAKTNLADIVATGYFTDSRDSTLHVVKGQNLGTTSKTAVDAQNLSGAGDKTIADNLARYTEALALTVTPGGTPTLSNTSTPATIVIKYEDAEGAEQTTTLTFAESAKGDAQTTSLPANSKLTEVTTTGWSAGTFSITTETTYKDVADTLGAYSEAQTLTVDPDSSAALTDTATDGTIVIKYEDADGVAHSITLSFTDTAKGDAQTTTLPADARITSVETTGWKAGAFDITVMLARTRIRNPEANRPGRLRVKYDGSLTDHKVLIRGVRKVGLVSTDTLPMREEIVLDKDATDADAYGDAKPGKLGEKYFHKINAVIVKDSTGAVVATPAGTVEIISEPGGYETKLVVRNDDPEGLSFEADVGGEPRVVNRGIVIDGSIDIEDTISATYNVLSNRVDKFQTLEERDTPQFTSMMAADREKPAADREFERVTERFYSGHGRFLEIDGEAVICNSVGLNVAHNYDFVSGKVPGIFRRDTDATDRRLTTASVNTNYESGSAEEDVFVRWDDRYRNREKVNVSVGTYQWLGSGRQLSVIYRMKRCDIQSPVRVPASSPGVVPVDIELKALPLPGQVDSELEVIIVSDDKWQG